MNGSAANEAASDGARLEDHIADVARLLLGAPNKHRSDATELRFGTHGSLSVDLKKGVWCSHEDGKGGGVLDLIARETGRRGAEAVAWMRDNGFDVPPLARNGHAPVNGKPRSRDSLGAENKAKRATSRPTLDDGARVKERPPLGPIVTAYDYVDEEGELLFQVCRYEPKDFRQRRPDATKRDGWNWKLGDTRRVLYRLPDLLATGQTQTIYVTEGEKDADRLWSLRVPATTNPQGAGNWGKCDSAALTGRHAVILPDNDQKGESYAQEVAQDLSGRAASVRVLRLPDLPPKGDVSDWLDAGGTPELLQEMAARATVWGSNEAAKGIEADSIPGDAPFDTSHDGLALKFGEQSQDARYVALWGRWYFFSGQRWEADEKLLHMTRMRAFLRMEADGLVRWARKQAKEGESDKRIERCEAIAKTLRLAPTVNHVASLSRSNPDQAASAQQWDADPWLLGTPGGTVDLRTGIMRKADPGDYITKQAAVAPAPAGTEAPLWQAFLTRIFRHDPELIDYMQRVAGYALTGQTTEHALIFAWGMGGNGKSVFFNILAYILDEYAKIAAPDLLLVTANDRHPTDMAMLRGARLVLASELGPDRAWDEPKLKSLTGGDLITARFMKQDFFTFMPQFTLLIAGNHKPKFKSIDEAIRRRVQLVPFLQNLSKDERDPNLTEKLKAEAPAILRWMIDGCLDWQRDGLSPPQSVVDASASYLEDEDVLGQWLDERCVVGVPARTPREVLFADWSEWCRANGGPGWSSADFGKYLGERGFPTKKSNGTRGHQGIALKPKANENPGDDGDGRRPFEGAL